MGISPYQDELIDVNAPLQYLCHSSFPPPPIFVSNGVISVCFLVQNFSFRLIVIHSLKLLKTSKDYKKKKRKNLKGTLLAITRRK